MITTFSFFSGDIRYHIYDTFQYQPVDQFNGIFNLAYLWYDNGCIFHFEKIKKKREEIVQGTNIALK